MAAPATPVVVSPTTGSALRHAMGLRARVVAPGVRAAGRARVTAMIAAIGLPATSVAVLVAVRPGRRGLAARLVDRCPTLRCSGRRGHGLLTRCDKLQPGSGLPTMVGGRGGLAGTLAGTLGGTLGGRRLRGGFRGRTDDDRTDDRTGCGSRGGPCCRGGSCRSAGNACSVRGCARPTVRSLRDGGLLRRGPGSRRNEGRVGGLHSRLDGGLDG